MSTSVQSNVCVIFKDLWFLHICDLFQPIRNSWKCQACLFHFKVCEGVNLAAMANFEVLMYLVSVTILHCCHDIIRS